MNQTATRDKLQAEFDRGMAWAVLSLCFDPIGVFSFAALCLNSNNKDKAKAAGRSAMLPIIGMALSIIGILRLILYPLVFGLLSFW